MTDLLTKYAAELDKTIEHSIGIERLNGAKILVVGATGTIGSWIAATFLRYNDTSNAGIMVSGTSRTPLLQDFSGRNDFIWLKYDLLSDIGFSDDFDYIIHAAGNAYPAMFYEKPVETSVGTVVGTDRLLAYGMKHVGPARKALAIPTFFNLLGPLVNPCRPKNSLHGTANQSQLRLYTNIHQKIGDNYGVITSYDGYDEISLTSGFKINTRYFEKVYTPLEMGLKYVKPSDIYGGETAEEAMRIFDNVLENKSTEAQKNVILANAACGISLMEEELTISETIQKARESLESGRAMQCFRKFVEINS